ncbi:hypothetical protein ACFQI3_12330 [Hansschlegelia quercus]|uniref:Uncharacterized protein n=1 Tax=Hansschlegelia quercus TaxID=2528245 RepID=A0A4Q9GKZ1_9HYPH|nr:hypothetical protein [Hansschlegelia quercus]TBN53364.1 hypothetical protein EYR15_10110 [Hansschlegelia quercus]
MDALKLQVSLQDAELLNQALDVYATTLMCAPLGLGLDLAIAARQLRDRLENAANQHEAVRDAAEDPDGNVLMFARV